MNACGVYCKVFQAPWNEVKRGFQSFNAPCLWKRHKKIVHGDPILLFEGFLFFRPGQVLWLAHFWECTSQALRFIMISPHAIYLTFPVAVHLSLHRQKHDRRGEERRRQRDAAKQRNMDFLLPSLKDIFEKMWGFAMHKYISSAKQTGKAVTFAEVLLN